MMIAAHKTAKYGDSEVPVLARPWIAAARLPYRKTYRLMPGQHWSEADVTHEQWEHYPLLPDGQAVPVGALIARELIEQGAAAAVFTELWGGRCVLIGPDLVCVEPDPTFRHLLDELRSAGGKRLGGLPDVLAYFHDGRIAMREAKNVAAKDKLGPKQHAFARGARKLLGNRLDLAIVEWGFPQ